MEGVVAGIAHYGNCVGVPTVAGEVAFDPSYSGNPLVNAMALGLMETETIVRSGCLRCGKPCGLRGQHHRPRRHGRCQLCQRRAQ